MRFDPNRWSGVNLIGSGSSILNNTITGGYNGIYINIGSSSNLIANNTMSDFVEGAVYAFGSSNDRIIGNKITKIGFAGVALDRGSTGNLVTNNVFETTRRQIGIDAGVHIYYGSGNKIQSNSFFNCSIGFRLTTVLATTYLSTTLLLHLCPKWAAPLNSTLQR
jgi:parallel beta-helix repeat protein